MSNQPPARRSYPWWRIGVGAGVGLLGVLVALGVAYPWAALGVVVWLGVVGGVGYLVAVRAWDGPGAPRDTPSRAEVESRGELGRRRGTDRWEATRRAVGSGLVGPGFTRGTPRRGHRLDATSMSPSDGTDGSAA